MASLSQTQLSAEFDARESNLDEFHEVAPGIGAGRRELSIILRQRSYHPAGRRFPCRNAGGRRGGRAVANPRRILAAVSDRTPDDCGARPVWLSSTGYRQIEKRHR